MGCGVVERHLEMAQPTKKTKTKTKKRVNENIPYIFDYWADPVVHLLIQKSFMGDPITATGL